MKQILIEKYIEPSEIKVDGNYIFKRWFDKYEYLHSFMGQPAEVWNCNGQMERQICYKKGDYHRVRDLPAIIHYNSNGQIMTKQWYKKGDYHRAGDLPICIEYKNEQISRQWWYKKGVFIKEENC